MSRTPAYAISARRSTLTARFIPRFRKEHASLALKAAGQLQLNVLASNDPKVAEIAARLPVGRVHATGRMFVPFIRHDLYDKLLAAAADRNGHPTSPPNGSSGASGSTPGGSAPHLPQNWREIGVGDLVVANEGPEEGWYEAIVVEAERRHAHVTAGVTTRGSDGLCGIGCGSDCSIRDPNRPQRMGNQRKLGPDKTRQTRRSRPRPQSIRCPRTGTRLTSITSCWPKTTANGGRGGKPSRSRRPVTCSSCAGARSMRPTSG